MIRVLCDAIHADLWESLRLLFEVRMGWELYRPIGMEWHDRGIWRFEQHQPYGLGVAHQFLDPWPGDMAVEDAHGSWSERADTTHPPQVQRLVTMEQAAELRPDLVLATLAENELGWRQWADDHGAHYGIQVGNQDAANVWAAAEFGLLSVTTPGFTPWKPHVTYRQEFSLDLFHADGGAGALTTPVVMNRVQCTTQTPDYQTFRELAAAIPEAHFRWYGHCEPRDELWGGDHHTTAEVATSMHGARVAFHAKRWSDGYGHVIHNWAAIGRPMLVTASYYQDKLAAPLFVEGVTSYDLQSLGRGDLEAITRRLIHDDDHWRRMCEAAAARFREVVSFDQEAEQIRTMLESVLSDRLAR